MDAKQQNPRHAELSVCAVWLDSEGRDCIVRLHDGHKWNEVLRAEGPVVNCSLYGVDLAKHMPEAKRVDSHDALLEALKDTLYFLERHSNRWDGVNGKHPNDIAIEARAALVAAGVKS